MSHNTLTKFSNRKMKKRERATSVSQNHDEINDALIIEYSLGTEQFFFIVICILIWFLVMGERATNRRMHRNLNIHKPQWHIHDTQIHTHTPGAFFWVSYFPLRRSALHIFIFWEEKKWRKIENMTSNF